jgi:carbamoylphosphate synthase large subunit
MKILFVGARLFEDIALYVKNKGITSILTESNPDSKNLELADVQYIVPRGMEGPKEVALKEDVDAVVPLIGIDKPLIEVAKFKKDLEDNYGLPVVASPLNAVITARDKQKTKELFIKNKIKTPEFIDISKNQLKQELPVVLKKLEGQGGSGVKIATNNADLEDCIDDFKGAIAEKFIPGIEISIEVLRYDEKAVPLVPVYKGRTTLDCIHPLDKLKTAPLEVDNLNNEYIRGKASEIANILGSEGNIDIDIIFDEKDSISYFIEINTRLSGTRYLTTASTTVNPVNELVDMALGEWNPKTVEKRIKKYNALEIPIGNYKNEKNNYKFRNFNGKNSWVIHGPSDFQRITIRAESFKKAFKTAEELNIDYTKFL